MAGSASPCAVRRVERMKGCHIHIMRHAASEQHISNISALSDGMLCCIFNVVPRYPWNLVRPAIEFKLGKVRFLILS